MAELLPSEVPLKKRKVEAAAAGLGGPCSQEPASLLSPSALLLQIPPCTNTSLPVWDHMRAAQVEALWSVTPYGITVQMTPLTSQKTQGKTHSASQPAVLLKTQPSAQPVPFKLTCKMHHTPYPFHWQLRCSDTHQWVNVSLSAQVTLEKLYCDVDRETIKLQDSWEQAGTDVFTLNFHTMRLRNSDKYDKVRRLSTSSDTERNPFLSTEWNFYWWNNSSWEKYETELSKGLLGAMEAGESWCRFHIGKQMYEVDFSSMTQKNVTTGFQRRVQRRPTFHSPFSLKSNLKTVVLVDTSTPVSQDLSSLNVDPLQEFSSWYPPVWTLTPDQGYSLVEVPPNSKAYQSIHSMFHQTLSENKVEIISILQVQNVFQWDKYQRQKQHMQSRSPDQAGSLERHLFHGTTEDSAKEICQNNFDPRVSGKNGVAYGRGSYFARDASYSFKYAASSCQERCQHMFLAKVLVGNMTAGNSSYTRPPPLDPSNSGYELYDTCVNQIPNPSIFVVFDSCQCYPYFLIRYKVVPDIVNVCK
ncbi:hypothetical protein AGOR_G00186420 [Albula goreensis]|uniref:Poly [ADP-ribose] polymerase n=1 Tax=Albula goreensis TaxID=1534307 RepID=A0A8T3CTB8_9TELE|nr:hypothetical protein AGOR_G00186420 [Albula goreensis]